MSLEKHLKVKLVKLNEPLTVGLSTRHRYHHFHILIKGDQKTITDSYKSSFY